MAWIVKYASIRELKLLAESFTPLIYVMDKFRRTTVNLQTTFVSLLCFLSKKRESTH